MTTASPSSRAAQEPSTEAKIRALRSPAAYWPEPHKVETIETHFAWIFFTEDTVFKLKKPGRYDSLDLRDLAARARNCSEEVRLNRRLAPEVYLGVSPLVQRGDGALRIGGPGVVVDWLVRMRRLPAAAMLDRAIASGTASRDALLEVGTRLADFYRSQPAIEFEPAQYLSRIAERMDADRTALLASDLGLDGELVRSAAERLEAAFAQMRMQLAQRAHERRIVEAHGDLRPEHIFLGPPPCIIDCLEFSLDLRILDPGEELAFLSLECLCLGREDVAKTVLDGYLLRSADRLPAGLFEFYRARRAMVRAKVVAWHLLDPAYRDRAAWRERAHTYLERTVLDAQHCVAPA